MTAADSVLEALGPAVRQQAGLTVEDFVGALLEPAQPVDDLVRPADGVGWSSAFNLDATVKPRWLAQLVGVDVPVGLSDGSIRELIRQRPAFLRGTPGAMLAAVRQHLTGTRRIDLTERYQGSAYRIRVVTYAAETPDPAAVERALRATKPAGIVLTYDVFSGVSYDELNAMHATHDAMDASAATFDVLDSTPPGGY